MRKGAKMNYTQNHDPNYYEENRNISNCGSFAFQIKEWYSPDGEFENEMGYDIDEWVEQGIHEGFDEWEMSDGLANALTEYILSDFDDVRYLINPSDVQPDEELIAFRTFVTNDFNWDFHFKVLRNGLWQEKCGSDPVRFCEEDDWHNGLMEYISYTSYFAKKLAS